MSESVIPSASTPDNASTTDNTPQTTSEPKATSTAPVKEKIKVDGVEEEWSPEELKKFAQIGRAKEKRFEESAKVRKEAEAKLERLKNNPWEVLKELGLDPRKVSEEFLGQQLEEELLAKDPVKKAQRDKDRELEELRKEKLEREEARQQAEFEALKTKHIEQLDNDLDRALSTTELPKTPGVIRRVAKYLHDALADGEDMTVEEAVALVEQDYSDEVSQLFGSAKNPKRYLPSELAKKLMDEHLSQVKSAPKYSQDHAQQQNNEPQTKYISSSEWMKKIMS